MEGAHCLLTEKGRKAIDAILDLDPPLTELGLLTWFMALARFLWEMRPALPEEGPPGMPAFVVKQLWPEGWLPSRVLGLEID